MRTLVPLMPALLFAGPPISPTRKPPWAIPAPLMPDPGMLIGWPMCAPLVLVPKPPLAGAPSSGLMPGE